MRQMVTAMCLLESLVLNCGDSLLSHEWQCGSPVRSYFGRLLGLLWNSLGLVAPSREQVWVLQIYLTVISLVPHSPWAQNLPSRPYGKSLPVSQGRWRKIHFLFQEPNRKGRDDLKSDWNGDVGSNWKCPLNPLPFLRRKLTDKEGSRPWRAQRSTQKEMRGNSSS